MFLGPRRPLGPGARRRRGVPSGLTSLRPSRPPPTRRAGPVAPAGPHPSVHPVPIRSNALNGLL
eukprot:1572093-Pyramimonas_sp.AAC.1